ncbi:hypothetical protein [Rhizobium sp. L51/94]|uniref:hypothetical protein n=1 Tax=Rhizobium sp. L51/94 TaxID=2819999 RepID=UPI001C5A65A0|nr:hypothetical protein [Rhizobium sp. L51/94]QXZ80490.1 hypothetical protein J5274_21990 [Rhizobium sp. L51/94]
MHGFGGGGAEVGKLGHPKAIRATRHGSEDNEISGCPTIQTGFLLDSLHLEYRKDLMDLIRAIIKAAKVL